jgi:hypothetical protein
MGDIRGGAPPRVLIVQAAQWPRALLRAALRHEGYDALGARDLPEAVSSTEAESGRGPVRLIILDQDVLQGGDAVLKQLLSRHHEALTLILESAFHPSIQGTWPNVLRHPVTIAEIVKKAQGLVPLPSAAVHPME